MVVRSISYHYSTHRGSPRALTLLLYETAPIVLVFFTEIAAKTKVKFLSAALKKSQIASEAIADFSNQEPGKNAMALVMRQVLGLLKACGFC